MLGRLNHVAIAVPDLKAAVALYRRSLEAIVTASVQLPEHGVTVAFVELPNTKIDLQTKVNEDLIGGFTIETNNKLVDASIAHDLKIVQKQFMKNIYVPDLR